MNQIVVLNISKEELQAIVAEIVREEVARIVETVGERSGKEYLSADEVCVMYNLSKSTLYKLTASREIPSMKTGKRLLLRKADLDVYVSSHRRASVSEIRANL